ncbi:MAG: cobyrinate a,c-diamide synthase [Candidatus Bipolaricaulota bacterium]
MKGLVLAGTGSGSGKTVVTLALLKGLLDYGEDPQPAKIGPDYIDPSHHYSVAGKHSRTLDLWMQGERGLARNYYRGEGTICVAEGVMGMYDGRESSTAAIAEKLGLPVVLVVDGKAGMESVAATAFGFSRYGKVNGSDVEVAGIVAQRTGGGKHERGIVRALPPDLEYFGRIPDIEELEIPERHLGLHMAGQDPVPESVLKEAGEFLEVEKLLETASDPDLSYEASEEGKVSEGETIGMAHDEAFNFLYPRTRERLSEADLVTFSPLEGEEVPDADFFYLPGGYPELYPGELEESPTLTQLADLAEEGVPIFGECGGMMAMSRSLTTTEGKTYEMAGILPAEVEMTESLQGLGYVEVRARSGDGLFSSGESYRGHEFHYSRTRVESGAEFAFDDLRGAGIDGSHDGLRRYNAVGTYGHFHPESGLFDDFLDYA